MRGLTKVTSTYRLGESSERKYRVQLDPGDDAYNDDGHANGPSEPILHPGSRRLEKRSLISK